MKKTTCIFIISTCLGIVAKHTAHGQPGSLDLTFGSGGIVTTDWASGNAVGKSVTIQSDGKIVVAGYCDFYSIYSGFALFRYNSDGSLDNTFGSNGIVFTDFVITGLAYSVAIQSDGKIVVAGLRALARYNTDGTLDSTFDSDGMVATYEGDEMRSVALQSNGKIVAAGFSGYYSYDHDFALARYNSDGTLDSTFSSDGRVTTDFGGYSDFSYSLAIQSDGKIVVVGSGLTDSTEDFAVARYYNDGTLDSTFSSDGKVTTDFENDNSAHSVAIQNDGKLVVIGTSFNGFTSFFALARYNADGTLDSTFDSDGKVTTAGNNSCILNSIAIQNDGKIVVAGVNSYNGNNYGFELIRYNSDGSLDNSFGSAGEVNTPIGTESGAYSVTIQSDGKIVVVGCGMPAGDCDVAVARYNADFGIGIAENSAQENTIAISPNPFTTEFVVTGTAAQGELILFDILGKEILRQSRPSGTSETRINTENLLPGFYLLNYNNENKTAKIKLIKF